MHVDNILDFIEAVKSLVACDGINEVLEPTGDYKLLTSVNSGVISHLKDLNLFDILEQVELSAGYYLLQDSGLKHVANEARLNKEGFKIKKISLSDYGFTHALVTDKFSIFFSA